MSFLSNRPLFILVLLSTTVLSITLLGGCPTQQTPDQPADQVDPNDDQGQLNPPTVPDTGDDRPVTIPTEDEDEDDDADDGDADDGDGDGTGGGGDGDDTGQDPAAYVALQVSEPLLATVVRPGTTVQLSFFVAASAGHDVSDSELIIARDSDKDGAPDGDVIFTKDITAQKNTNTYDFNTQEIADAGLLGSNQVGSFVIGVRVPKPDGTQLGAFSTGTVTIDAVAPAATWIGHEKTADPASSTTVDKEDHLVNRDISWTMKFSTQDNSEHQLIIELRDMVTEEPVAEFARVTYPAGDAEHTITRELTGMPTGTFHVYFEVNDGFAPVGAYAVKPGGDRIRLAITDRIIGEFPLGKLDPQDPAYEPLEGPLDKSQGAILQGFNFNDLAGSSIAAVPDLNEDGYGELIIGARFGKAFNIQHQGVGFGEAYMIYGSDGRLHGVKALNAVGKGPEAGNPNGITGLKFPGIRTPRNANIAPSQESTRWTSGLSAITVVPDMDGDDLPELVFSFPRVESINLGETDPSIQHSELVPDLPGMGRLEYNAYKFNGFAFQWYPNESQFTRGGVVIVSSHNELLRFPTLLNRKSDRFMDLHEVGQLFDSMSRPQLVPYIRSLVWRGETCADCDLEPPSNCDPGELGDPNDPNDQGTPGECGEDDCLLGGDPNDPNSPFTDGREQLLDRWVVRWDVVFNNQGPGGFHMPWHAAGYPAYPSTATDPPLANPSAFPFNPMYPFPFVFYRNYWYPSGACGLADGCEVTNEWYVWLMTLPGTTLGGTPSWATGGQPNQDPYPECYPPNYCVLINPPGACGSEPPCSDPNVTPAASGSTAWTGFYGPSSVPYVFTQTGDSYPTPIGARILGQKVNDRFGTSISADGTWLFISAPKRSANESYLVGDPNYVPDVGDLDAVRSASGVVYQLRTDAPAFPGGPTRTQLWLERRVNEGGFIEYTTWPNGDVEDAGRTDYTMPVPHQYIIESVGSLRGNPSIGVIDTAYEGDCPPGYDPGTDSPSASAVGGYQYPVGTSGYYMDRTPQIVGPHDDAELSFVRALGDVNGDGIRDFAIGSERIRKTDVTPPPPGNPGDPYTVDFTGPEVGSVFIVYGQQTTGEAQDYLLEQLAFDTIDPDRLNGVLLQGESSGEKLARVFDHAGDFNGDGYDDVVIGNEGTNGNAGEVIVLLGASNLLSPAGGWTTGDAVFEGVAIRFFSANPGDLVGANVAGIGNVDGDSSDEDYELSDILIAAPGAEGGKGAVYLIYGAADLTGDIDLAQVGTVDLPGAKFVGRIADSPGTPANEGDQLGGGVKLVENTDPDGNATLAFSRGVARLGDIDGDGYDDYAISAMLADPLNKTDSGEVYIIYGAGDPQTP